MKTVYKILTPIFCIAALPIAIFMPAIRLLITSSLSKDIMSSFGIKQFTSIYDLIKLVSTAKEGQSDILKLVLQIFTEKDSKIAQMLTTTPWLIVTIVILAVILITMLVSAVLAIMGKSGTTTITAGACSILSIVMNKCFTAFAFPFVSGRIGLKTLMSGSEENLLTQLIGSAATVSKFEMSFMYQALMLLCAATAIFSLFAYFDKKYN